jgi:uncharacterized membrane protein
MTVGCDVTNHYLYLHYLVANHRLPPITEGGQCFQAPLFYVLAALLHGFLGLFFDHEAVDRLLRLFPVFCGIGLVEVAYRFARRSFPDDFAAQRVALLMTAFTPVVIIRTNAVGNESLSALLGAVATLAVFEIVTTSPNKIRTQKYVMAGFWWGLSALAKVSALVLAAPFTVAFLWWLWAWPNDRRQNLRNLAALVVAFAVSCGWYFVRTQILYGKPVVGGWDPLVGFEWWQFPGYRTLDQYLTFGVSLSRPVFGHLYGIWDGLYSGLWFDADFSGVTGPSIGPTWNMPFATAAVLCALLPTVALIIGAGRSLWLSKGATNCDPAAAFAPYYALLVVGAYFASILGHSLVLPYYNAIKASYGLAAVPLMAVLIAGGMQPLLRNRWTRLAVHAWFVVWITLVVVGYWALTPQ